MVEIITADGREAFDYDTLDHGTAEHARRAAQSIRAHHSRAVEAIIDTGKVLNEVKNVLEHGRFTSWLRSEFGWAETTARSYMRAAEVFGDKTATVADLPPTIIYALASPSTPADVRSSVIDRIEAGDRLTPDEIKRIVVEAKEAQRLDKAEAKKSPEQKKKERDRKARRQREHEQLIRECDAKNAERSAAMATAAAMLVNGFTGQIDVLIVVLEKAESCSELVGAIRHQLAASGNAYALASGRAA